MSHFKPPSELNRMLAAAVVSPSFCQLLLTDPVLALESGYEGSLFELSNQERDLVLNIEATTLAEFAQKVSEGQLECANKALAQLHRFQT